MRRNRSKASLVSTVLFLVLLVTACAPAVQPTATPAPPTVTSRPAAATPTSAVAPAATATASRVVPTATAPARLQATPTAAAETPRYGGMVAVTNSDPPGFDVHQQRSAVVLTPVGPEYNGVVRYDPKDGLSIIGDLAKSWEVSADGTVYTFHLYDSVKFHDGKPLTAEDVKYSLDRIVSPPKGVTSQRQSNLAAIKEVTVVDPTTVKVTLHSASAAFMKQLAGGWILILPKHMLEAGVDMQRTINGSGAFMFKTYDRGVSFTVVKNPNYFKKGLPYLDGITFFILTDANAIFAAFRTGKIHSTGLNASRLEVVRKELPQVRVGSTLTNPQVFVMNTKVAPWTDVRVRKAVNLAVDRQGAVASVVQGLGDIGLYAIPEATGYTKDVVEKLPGFRQPKTEDRAQAKKLLADAGFPNGFKTIMMTRNSYRDSAIYMVDQLGTIGITATIDLVEDITDLDRRARHAFETVMQAQVFLVPDPEDIYARGFSTGGPENDPDWSNAEFDKLLGQQRSELDAAKRKALHFKMETIIYEEAPRVSIYWGVSYQGQWPQLRNRYQAAISYNNNNWEDVWLSQ